MGLPLNTGFINLTNNMPAVATAEEHSLSQKGDPLVWEAMRNENKRDRAYSRSIYNGPMLADPYLRYTIQSRMNAKLGHHIKGNPIWT